DYGSADHQHQLALQVPPFADPVRLGGVGKVIAGDRWGPDRTLFVEHEHSFEVRAVAPDVRAQDMDVLAGGLKSGRSRGDPHKPPARFEDGIGTNLDLAADR